MDQNQELVVSEATTRREQMVQILQDVESLKDVTRDHIERLNQITDGPMIITKFMTSVQEFDEWSSAAGKGIRDVGLDEKNEYFVVRWRYVWALEGILNFKVSGDYLHFKSALSDTSKSFYLAIRSKSSSLDNGIDAPEQEFDRILYQHYSLRAPVMAIEFAFSNSHTSLSQSSTQVLRGFDNVRKLIIILKIIPQSAQRPSLDDNWDLTDAEIQEMNPNALCRHACDWYHEKGMYASEEFYLTVYHWNGMTCSKIPTEIYFRHNESVNMESVPNLPFKTRSRLPEGRMELVDLEFPLRQLVFELNKRWSRVEEDRIAECVAFKQGRRSRE